MIALLGASGFVGAEFRRRLKDRGIECRPIARRDVNIYDRGALSRELENAQADFLINCAGYTGKPNVDACETNRLECFLANAVLPHIVAKACDAVGIPFGHISSGCIFNGRNESGSGFGERDVPNFSFRFGNCSYYSGTKALGEEVLWGSGHCYIWRLRIPFDNAPSPRNYLSKLMAYERLLEAENSLSHLGEFVDACIDCAMLRLPYGIYNLTNPGAVLTSEVTTLMKECGLANREFRFFRNEDEFMRLAAKTPRSNCVLDSSKALRAGLRLSPVKQALRDSLGAWRRSR